jgi:glycosyltransferase involved in cell wall biosynthesis
MAPAALSSKSFGGSTRVSPQSAAPKHLLHAFSTFAVGGQQTRFVSLANAFGGKYRHTVLAMDGNHEAAAGLASDVDFTIQTMPVVKSGGVSLANLRTMQGLLKRLRPDLLCTYNWGTIEWALANRLSAVCPQIHIEDGFGPDEAPDRQHFRRRIMRRFSLSRCVRVVVPSRMLQDVAIRKWRLAAEQVLYLPNGIDCERFARPPDGELLKSFGIADDHLVVGTVAALRAEKNLERLLNVFAASRPPSSARLVIVGDGPQRDMLVQAASRLGISDRTIMTGAMKAPERILGRFDVFALSSDTEQMPNSVLEAMAAGLAVLATDVGDVKQMLAAENAVYVLPREDVGGLAQGLLRLLEDGAARQGIGGMNRAKVRSEYALETMVRRYDGLFETAIAGKVS